MTQKKQKPKRNIKQSDALPINAQQLPIQTQETRLRERSIEKFWPDDRPLPGEYIKFIRAPLPCQKCRRIRFNNGPQCVVCTHSGSDTAFFACKSCGHRFEMPVSLLEPIEPK